MTVDEALLGHGVEHTDAPVAGEVVVANAGAPQFRIRWPGARAQVTGTCSKFP